MHWFARLYVIVTIWLIAGLVVPCMAQDEGGKRIALVVGNSGYRAVPGLANTSNDARLLARTLKAKGFTLIGGDARIDLDRAQFNAALDQFAQALPGADVALFFYAGHGMQVRGANWLVPIDASPRKASDLDTQMVNAVRVLSAMKSGGTKLNLVILDACRDNPFPDLQTPGGESGLSPIQKSGGPTGRGLGGGGGLAQMQAPEGTVIAFATQPGDVALDGSGGDSPFTIALVQALQQPGLDVLLLFNQVGVAVKHATGGQQQPWISSSPIEGEYFLGQQGGGAPMSMPQARPAQIASPASIRVRDQVEQTAVSLGIPVPNAIPISPPAADVPPPLARFVGVWGPGEWAGRNNTNKFILAVNDMNPAGQAHITIMNSSGCVDETCTVHAPFIGHLVATVQDGRLMFRNQRNGREFSFWLARDDQLNALQMMAAKTLATSLRRID
jgi:uncharacterized caspase-like protein